MPVYAITGSSRGLGYNYARLLLEAQEDISVIALCRNPSGADQLRDLKNKFGDRIEIVKHEADKEESAKDAVKQIEGLDIAKNGIDVLINNAGVMKGGFAKTTEQTVAQLKENFETNVYGVIYTTSAFLPLLRKGSKKQIIFISSIMGSLGVDMAQMPIGSMYSMSKTAVNMYAAKLAGELKDDNFTVIPFHPGYVQTDMNNGPGGGAPLTVEEATTKAVKVFLSIKPEDNMKFLQWDGETLPW